MLLMATGGNLVESLDYVCERCGRREMEVTVETVENIEIARGVCCGCGAVRFEESKQRSRPSRTPGGKRPEP